MNAFDELAQILGIVVRKALEGGQRETDAVPHAGVDVLVGQDHITALGEGGDGGHAREVAGHADMAGFTVEEGRELFFQIDVVGAGTVGQAGAGGARAPFQHGGAARLDHGGVKGEAEIIVAGQHDHVAAVQADVRALLPLHGVVIRRVLQPHFGGVVVAASLHDRLLVPGEQSQRHKSCAATLSKRGRVSKPKGPVCARQARDLRRAARRQVKSPGRPPFPPLVKSGWKRGGQNPSFIRGAAGIASRRPARRHKWATP